MVKTKWTDIQDGRLDKAVVIDFEGFEKMPPALCGVWIDGELEQVVFQKELEPAARYTAEKDNRRIYYKELDVFLDELIETVLDDEDRLFIAFSKRELELLQDHHKGVGDRYVNALPVAKKWREGLFPSAAEKAKANRRKWKKGLNKSKVAKNRYYNKVGFRLVDYWRLAGIKVPATHGVRKTTKWLREVLDALEKKSGLAESLSAGQKKAWTRFVNHNRRDVVNLYELLKIILEQYES